MLAQVQNLREFVIRDLAGVIDWSRDVRDDPDQKSTTDHAAVVIKTPFNSYKLTCRSTYIEPPAGAPATCKSLGTVTFDDPAGDKHLVGPKADNTYGEIAKHIRVRELADALAIARREAAEAPAEKAAEARAKLADVAARAQKAGIKVREEDLRTSAPPLMFVPKESAEVLERAIADAGPGHVTYGDPSAVTLVQPVVPVGAPANELSPYIGCPAVFITNPGEAIGGMTEIPGFISKLQPGGRISMFVMPDNSEVTFRDNLPRRGSDAGDGKVHRSNCWDFNPEHVRLVKRIQHLEEAIGKNADEGNADRFDMDAIDRDVGALARTVGEQGAVIAQLLARIGALEAKPKRGRKPRTAADEMTEAQGEVYPDAEPSEHAADTGE